MAEKHKFANKWSSAIEEHGYTCLPNLVLYKRSLLQISPSELLVLMCIESFRHDNKDPFPSELLIGKRACLSGRTVRRHLLSLEKKKVINRHHRRGRSTVFSLEPLIFKLDQYAVSTLPHGKKCPPTQDKTYIYGRSNLTGIKDSFGKDQFNKNGEMRSIKELVEKHPTNSNDFGRRQRYV